MELHVVARAAGALVVTGLLVVLIGCTGTGTGTTSPRSSTTSSPTTVARAAGHVTVGCSMSRPVKGGDPSVSDDVVIGPLWYPGLAHGYPGGVGEAQDGIIFAKIGTQLLPDATVTVSVASDARGWAGIATESGPPAGYTSVTFISCPASQNPTGVWWVGGFTLRNRTSGCLPLDVQIQGEQSVRHTVISLWDNNCA